MQKFLLLLAISICGLTAPDALRWAAAQTATTPDAPARTTQLSTLFDSLAKAEDSESTLAISEKIQALWLTTDSSTADLLMRRALFAMHTQNLDVALNVLDKLVELAPDWAEAWNKRATVRYMLDDETGSMEDITRVLKLEPRHFGALNGAAMIFEQRENKAEALKAYRHVLDIAPQWPQIKAHVEKLANDVEGQGI